jgi:hypothetical protein
MISSRCGCRLRPKTIRGSSFACSKKIAKEADHIVTVSENSKRDIIELLGVDERRISNTYQAVDFLANGSSGRRHRSPTSWKDILASACTNTCCFMERWNPRKMSAGRRDYFALVRRFAAEGVIRDMGRVYSDWADRCAGRLGEGSVVALKRLTRFLKLAIKSAGLPRMAGTLL